MGKRERFLQREYLLQSATTTIQLWLARESRPELLCDELRVDARRNPVRIDDAITSTFGIRRNLFDEFLFRFGIVPELPEGLDAGDSFLAFVVPSVSIWSYSQEKVVRNGRPDAYWIIARILPFAGSEPISPVEHDWLRFHHGDCARAALHVRAFSFRYPS